MSADVKGSDDGPSRRLRLHGGRRPKASSEGTRERLGRRPPRYGDLIAVDARRKSVAAT